MADMIIERDVGITMDDGLVLRADIFRPKDQHKDASAASRNMSDNQCAPWVSLKVNAASRATAWPTAMTLAEYRYGSGVRKAGTTKEMAT